MCLAIPGEVLEISDGEALLRTGRVSFGGMVREVNLACVPEARAGDFVIVHVGLALSVVDRVEAERVFEYLRQVGEMQEPEGDDK